jgi:hypothetical protein
MTLLAAEGYCGVQAIRFGRDDVAGGLAEVRAFMREHDVRIGSWWLSERSTPDDAEERLLDLGLVRVPCDYELDGMLLTTEPPPGPADVEARRVRTSDEYAAARLLQFDVFDSPADHRRDRAALVEEFERGEGGVVYAAWVGGELVAAGRAFSAPRGAVLAGGATAEWARGRGAYRALVRARWDDAVERGAPALVVQAGSMSAPILRRLGFETVCHFHRLQDEL